MMVSLLPQALRRPLRNLHRRASFKQALRRFMRDPVRVAERPGPVFDQLVYGWGNSGWSGQREYLQACIEHALECRDAILECGSGLTTLLVGFVAQSRGLPMWTLEHLPEWASRVQGALSRFHIDGVHLCTRPLRDYGDYDWYSLPLQEMPDRFGLVICDGPPAATRGGRYGLGPVMRERIAGGCTILLDDAVRSEEQHVAERWSRELGMSCDRRGTEQMYFVLVRPVAGH
jgi:Methyltransferase domain